LILAASLLSPEYANDAGRIREAFQRVLARDPEPDEIAAVEGFVGRYSTAWLAENPGAPRSGVARLAAASAGSRDVTAGIVRSDGLAQDQEIFELEPPEEDPSLALAPGSAGHAAWGAFVQALYASAEFRYVR
jgi:hypothetical protein